jgi:hypothetical protein
MTRHNFRNHLHDCSFACIRQKSFESGPGREFGCTPSRPPKITRLLAALSPFAAQRPVGRAHRRTRKRGYRRRDRKRVPAPDVAVGFAQQHSLHVFKFGNMGPWQKDEVVRNAGPFPEKHLPDGIL